MILSSEDEGGYSLKEKLPLSLPMRSARLTSASMASPSTLKSLARRMGTLSSPSRLKWMSSAESAKPVRGRC